jgi:hypothetical protein
VRDKIGALDSGCVRLADLYLPTKRCVDPPLSIMTFTFFTNEGSYMAKLGRLTPIGFLVLVVLALAPTSWAQTRSPIAEQIAKTYGLDSFGQIEAIRYTFNIPGRNISHSWVWEPKTGKISYEGKDKDGKPVKVTFVQSELNGESTGTPPAPMHRTWVCKNCRSGRGRPS